MSVGAVTPLAAPALSGKEASASSSGAGVFSRRNLTIAGLVSLAALAFILILKLFWGMPLFETSPYAYFNDQGWAYLHLHWDIAYPGTSVDLVQLHGKWYSIYGPFPSLLMMPFLAITQNHLSDNIFYNVLGALNVGLLYLLFEQARESGFSRKTSRENILWAVFLYLGSTGLILTVSGGVWYEGHVAACFCLLLTLILALRRRFVWATVALSCGFLSRSTLLFAFPLLFFLAMEDGCQERRLTPFVHSLWSRRPDWALVPWRRLAGMVAVFADCVAFYLVRNWGMFGSPLETGYNLQLAQQYPFITHGLLSVRYVPANIVNDFFNFPHIVFPTHYSNDPLIDLGNSGNGISLFLTTPLFLFLFVRNGERSRLRVALWLTILLSMAFVLLYYTAGYPTFGPRYLFDIFPFAWLLLAINDIRMDWRVYFLGVFAIIINAFGAYGHYFHIFFFTIHNVKNYFLP